MAPRPTGNFHAVLPARFSQETTIPPIAYSHGGIVHIFNSAPKVGSAVLLSYLVTW